VQRVKSIIAKTNHFRAISPQRSSTAAVDTFIREVRPATGGDFRASIPWGK